MRRMYKAIAVVSGLVVGASLGMGQVDTAPDQPETPASQPPATQPTGGINLDLDGTGAEEAFDQIAKLAGVDLVVNDQQLWFNADPVFMKVKNGRFWPTFLEMCKQSRLNFNADSGGNSARTIQLYNGGGGGNDFSKLPQAESQGFIIMAQSAQRSASVQYDRPESANSNFYIQLRVFVDPAVNIMQMSQPTVSEAVDENGLSLVGGNRNNGGYFGNNMGALIQNLSVPLAYPVKVGKKIAKLKGNLRATAVVKSEVIEIESPLTAKVTKKELPDYDIIIQPLKAMPKNGENETARYELKVTIRLKEKKRVGGGGVRREMRNDIQNMVNGIIITDTEGHRINGNGWNGGGGNNVDVFDYNMNYQASSPNAAGQPAKVTWKVPVETKELRIPFELKDLLIP